jgi:hypothetical protein
VGFWTIFKFWCSTIGPWRFALTIAGILLVFGWIAWAVVENGGPLCGPETVGYCHHGKVTH